MIMYINLLVTSRETSIARCPIKGQIRRECASHPSCHQTCNGSVSDVCYLSCIINGCECPNGTVIDTVKFECVQLHECSGMH